MLDPTVRARLLQEHMVSHSRMTPSFGRNSRLRAVRAFAVAIALASPVAAFGQGDAVPRPVVDLKPGTANYKIRLEADGKVLMMDVARVTKSQKGSWVVSETTSFPGHVQSDEITVDKKTLIIHKRLFRDGDAVADLQFAGHHVTGMLSEGKEKLPVDADAGGIVFADGGGGEDVLAALPLAQGYTVEFRNFNIGSQQVKMLQLRVIDSETVSVPAGTFDTWKVLITSLDGGTDTYGLWVDKRTHRVVKMAISLPNVGNALATIELTK